MIVQIIYTDDPHRPQLVFDAKRFEEVKIKREDIRIEAQTYMLTPAGRRLASLIFEMVEPVSEITIRAVGNVITVDTGMGLKFSVREYTVLDSIMDHLDNLRREAFAEITSKEISGFVIDEACRAGVNIDSPWWKEASTDERTPDWLITKDGSAPS